MGATPWNHILTLYKQFQKLAMAKVCGAELGPPGGGRVGPRSGSSPAFTSRSCSGCFLFHVEVGLRAGALLTCSVTRNTLSCLWRKT